MGTAALSGDLMPLGGDLAQIPAGYPALPKMPPELRSYVDALRDPHPDQPLPHMTKALKDAAFTHQRFLAPLLAQAPPELIARWLAPIAAAPAWPPTQDEYNRRLQALILWSDTVPWVAWNKQTQRELGTRVLQRLPDVGTIIECVRPCCEDLLSVSRALSVILEDKTA